MHTPIILLLLVLAAGLSGCQSMTPEQRRAADEATCTGYGFRRNSDAFANCLMNQDLNRSANARALQASQDDFFWGPPFVVGGPGYYYGRGRYR